MKDRTLVKGEKCRYWKSPEMAGGHGKQPALHTCTFISWQGWMTHWVIFKNYMLGFQTDFWGSSQFLCLVKCLPFMPVSNLGSLPCIGCELKQLWHGLVLSPDFILSPNKMLVPQQTFIWEKSYTGPRTPVMRLSHEEATFLTSA